MTDVAGLMVLEKQRSTFLGGGMGSAREYSEKMAEDMDQHIKAELATHYEDVIASLDTYKDAIETMVTSLFEKETIDGDEVRRTIAEFEEANGMESRLQPEKENTSDIKKEKVEDDENPEGIEV